MIRALVLTLVMVATSAVARDDGVTSFTLDNGLEVVVIEDRRAPVVTQMIWYRVGSADEPQGLSGIAHFLEHMMFKATETLERGEFSAVVAANGGRDNAFTSFDYTAYFQRIASDRLDLVMQMEADRMRNLRFTDEDFVTEMQVILEERNQIVDSNANAVAREQLRAALFLNHRYGIPIIGWQHEIEAIGMEDLLAFYDTHYWPDNAVLIIAGDVEAAEVRDLAEGHFGPIPSSPVPLLRDRPAEPPHLAERRMIYEDARASQPYVTRSYLAPARRSGAQEEAAALVFLAEILGGSSFTSVLGSRLVHDTGVALFTGANFSGSALDHGTFTLTVFPAEGVSLQEAEDAMDEAVASLLTDGIDPDQLERIRMQLRAAEVFAMDNTDGRAREFGIALTTGLSVDDVLDWPRVLQEVTPEDILAAAAALFDRRQSVTMWVVPSREML
ncbi:MAG: insulinase family protein [Rubellimicrobium sp.]|nr:insulinase family protein [Rubellimicrobium sp.]